MIVKNEEDTLDRCLKSIEDIVDEIIIVDTGSSDKTKEIAKQYTDNIYDFEWVDDFSVARNYSFSKATKDYVMWLDADDVILEDSRIELKKLKENFNTDVDTVIMRYDLMAKNNANVVTYFYRERIVKRSKGFKWYDPVHEYILYSGTYMKVDIAVTHKKIHAPTRRNLDILERYIEKGNELTNRNCFYFARELYHAGEPEKAAIYYEKFLETEDGLISNYLDSCIELSSYYDYKKDDKKSMKTLLRFFEKEGPRAEICCRLGYYYKERKDYQKAISWFMLAPYSIKPVSLGGVMPHYWDYVPYMELCSCYYHIGDIDEAIKYNEKAAIAHPEDEKVCHNRAYLALIKERLIKKANQKNK